MKKAILFGAILLVVSIGFASARGTTEEGPAAVVVEEECYPGELDDRYCDRTGNMVADPPLDESHWLDPGILVFAYAPLEDPAVYEEEFEELIAFLEEELARPVRWFALRSYAAQVEAMRAGRLHISGVPAGALIDAVNMAGFVPQTIMGTEEGILGYRMGILTSADSGITSLDDVRGREIAFVSEGSASGDTAPRAVLYEQSGLLPGEDYDFVYSGSHDNSILGLYHGDYDVIGISLGVLRRMRDAGRITEDNDWYNLLYESPPFPPTPFGVKYRLHPELQEQIKDAFLRFDFANSRMAQTWDEDRFIEFDYERDGRILRTVRDGAAAIDGLLDE